MILQLNPTIPVACPKGKGQALFLIDYSSEHNLMWVIAIDETGEIWTFQNPEVRMQKNITMGRHPIFEKAECLYCKHSFFVVKKSISSRIYCSNECEKLEQGEK